MNPITNSIYNAFARTLPKMSHTEREALAAGSVWWDAELFSGNPDVSKLAALPPLQLTDEEQGFMNHEVQALCDILHDDSINRDKDLPSWVWTYLRKEGFFGLIIPKEYGGKGFSAYAHSEIVAKIATRSIAAAVTVMVPNSLGPAELLMHYGTDAERDEYLPKLATGEHLPCFGLTNPTAGSDAASIPDKAVVVERDGVLGLEVTLNKRYITLAPVATLIGLAVKVEDPDMLLASTFRAKLDEGRDITVLLVPRDTEGLEIGARHNPLDVAFMNGPIRGENVYMPFSTILGGPNNIGEGWAMLMDCLSVGRAISLPSLACAGGHLTAGRVGAYARIREQFRLPIGKFEGVEEKLAMIAGHAFIMDAARKLTINAIDNLGEKPSVLSAINKYHLTEMNRESIDAAMDIAGGSAICLGPENFLGQVYKSIPVSITVEGANIMTRNLIIFGQGAMRCHPYVMPEIEAVRDGNKKEAVRLLAEHVKHVFKNTGRTVKRGLFNEDLMRFSSAFALTADVTMLLLGGALKRKERVSARLGDILSYMYLLSAAYYEYNTNPGHSKAVFTWAVDTLQYKIQEAFFELYDNYPNKFVGRVLRRMAFPYGRVYKKPTDKLEHSVAQVLLKPSAARDLLTSGLYISHNADEKTNMLEHAFQNVNFAADMSPEDQERLATLRNKLIQVDDFKELK